MGRCLRGIMEDLQVSLIQYYSRHRPTSKPDRERKPPFQSEGVWEDLQHSLQIEERQLDEQTLRRIRDVLNWLRPTNVNVDQAALVEARADYPGTGEWLLENPLFREWFDPRHPSIPSLLWINGIPGAGKTVLASLVIQKAQELNPAPAVLYFYCKNDNQERGNFVSLGRSLLAQLLQHDNGLLASFYQESCRSVDAVLSSQNLIEELLYLAFRECKSAYIILDGLDDCPREERRKITKWFRDLVEYAPSYESGKLRCLFISQDDGTARKDYYGLESIKIRPEDSQDDIQEYCRIEAGKLRETYPDIPVDKFNWIAKTVADSVGARLIWSNLSSYRTMESLEEELEPHVFPKKIYDAYRHIMVRINEQDLNHIKIHASRLLGWLVCAKRPLKWHEIQVMHSIRLENGNVDLERRKFGKSPKDILDSLVETHADGSLEFVNSSVKSFLIEEGHVVCSREELFLANLCIGYLSLPIFRDPPTMEGIMSGDYGFMDYAVIFWLEHVEAGASLQNDKDDESMEVLAESLEIFIEMHWDSPTNASPLAKRHSNKLQYFRDRPFYDQLEQAAASTRKQLRNHDNMSEIEDVLGLASIVSDVRKALEKVASDTSIDKQTLQKMYGANLFKCPRFSCQFFTIGFSSAGERDKHASKHERPFRCSDENCVGYTAGFSSRTQCEKHLREKHLLVAFQDEEWLTGEEVENSIMDNHIAAGKSQVRQSAANLDDNLDGEGVTNTTLTESESEVEPQHRPRLKRPRLT
ncbi:hypothetical protein PG995_004242 [Apiospora arundinis]